MRRPFIRAFLDMPKSRRYEKAKHTGYQLFREDKYSIKEIAEKLKVDDRTVYAWSTKYKWKERLEAELAGSAKLKEQNTRTRALMYKKLEEALEGDMLAEAKQWSDAIAKVGADYDRIQRRAADLSTIIDVMKGFQDWLSERNEVHEDFVERLFQQTERYMDHIATNG